MQDEFLSRVDVCLSEEQRAWCDRVIEKYQVEKRLRKMASSRLPTPWKISGSCKIGTKHENWYTEAVWHAEQS